MFIGFYEDGCRIAPPNWNTVFTCLGKLFPRAMLGFGEVETWHAMHKATLVAHCYGFVIVHPQFAGEYFW